MAAWDKDLDQPTRAWEKDLDRPGEKKKNENPSFGSMLKEEALNSLPAKALGLREYLSGDPAQIAAAPPTRFAVGAAEPLIGIADRIAGNSNTVQDFNALAQQGGATGFNAAGMAGNVLSPASLSVGQLPIPSTLLGKTAMGAGVGAAGGFVAPAASNEEAMRNAALGAAFGGVLPAAIQGGAKVGEFAYNKILKPASDLFTKEGPSNILSRFIVKKVGEQNMPATLQKTGSVQDILPGGKPTVADAVAGLPEGSPLIEMQRIASESAGGPSAMMGQRALDQASAIANAKTARTAQSKVNYGKAFDPTLHKVQVDAELVELSKNPYFQQAAGVADKVAAAKKLNPEDNLTEMLHNVKMGLDKKLNPGFGEVGIDNAERGAILDLKNQLTAWLAKKNPDYEVGRAEHAAASKLIKDFTDRQELAKNPLQKTNLGGGVNIGEETRPHFANLLSRPVMAANWVMRLAGKNIEPEIDRLAALRFSDPAEFTRIMSNLPAPLQFKVDSLLRKTNALSFGAASAQ